MTHTTTDETTGIMTIDGTEYRYECSCGEHYSSIEAARRCRKCWVYAPDECCDEVIDLRHGGLVWAWGVNWSIELADALPKPREFRPTLADVWPASL